MFLCSKYAMAEAYTVTMSGNQSFQNSKSFWLPEMFLQMLEVSEMIFGLL